LFQFLPVYRDRQDKAVAGAAGDNAEVGPAVIQEHRLHVHAGREDDGKTEGDLDGAVRLPLGAGVELAADDERHPGSAIHRADFQIGRLVRLVREAEIDEDPPVPQDEVLLIGPVGREACVVHEDRCVRLQHGAEGVGVLLIRLEAGDGLGTARQQRVDEAPDDGARIVVGHGQAVQERRCGGLAADPGCRERHDEPHYTDKCDRGACDFHVGSVLHNFVLLYWSRIIFLHADVE